MNISGEMRAFYANGTRETLKQTDKESAIKKIERLLDDERGETIGSGVSADVILLDIWQGREDENPWVIKKQKPETISQDVLGIRLEDELDMQDRAWDIIEAERKVSNVPLARVPRPIAVLRDQANAWMTMEYVKGDTLLEHTLRLFLLELNEDDEERIDEIQKMGKDELLDMVTGDEYLPLLPPGIVEKIHRGEKLDEKSHFVGIALAVQKILGSKREVLNLHQWTALKNTVELLHRRGIWHRDLHCSNIIIEPNGEVVILDFGLATKKDPSAVARGESVYTTKVGHYVNEVTLRLLSDEKALEDYARLLPRTKEVVTALAAK